MRITHILSTLVFAFAFSAAAETAPNIEKWNPSCNGKTWPGSFQMNEKDLHQEFKKSSRSDLMQYLFAEVEHLSHPAFAKTLMNYLVETETVADRETFLEIFTQAAQLDSDTPKPIKRKDLCTTYHRYYSKYEQASK